MAATKEEILSGLAKILEEVADIDPYKVSMDKTFKELDVDSLSLVESVVAAEEEFGVKIPDDQVSRLVTVGDAVRFIQEAQN
ncbi:acyl carrier protein [Streptomyces lavendulae]|uniref:acyl carrier protein n=1 Tax=Streptomyces lavendulae TaxID=1914 RepID=UPI00369565E8